MDGMINSIVSVHQVETVVEESKLSGASANDGNFEKGAIFPRKEGELKTLCLNLRHVLGQNVST